MCPPAAIALVSLAITAASAVTGYIGASSTANNQAAYQAAAVQQRNAQMAANTKLATNDFNQKASQEQLHMQEVQNQTGQAVFQKDIQERQAEAAARVSAGQAGVAGLSIDALMADFQRQSSNFKDTSIQNLAMQQAQSNSNLESYATEAKGRAQSVQPYLPEPVVRPSMIATGLQIAGGAANAANQYQTLKSYQRTRTSATSSN